VLGAGSSNSRGFYFTEDYVSCMLLRERTCALGTVQAPSGPGPGRHRVPAGWNGTVQPRGFETPAIPRNAQGHAGHGRARLSNKAERR